MQVFSHQHDFRLSRLPHHASCNCGQSQILLISESWRTLLKATTSCKRRKTSFFFNCTPFLGFVFIFPFAVSGRKSLQTLFLYSSIHTIFIQTSPWVTAIAISGNDKKKRFCTVRDVPLVRGRERERERERERKGEEERDRETERERNR